MQEVLTTSDKELLTREILREDYSNYMAGNRIVSIVLIVFMVIGIAFFLTFLLLALRKRKSNNDRTRRLAKTWIVLMSIGMGVFATGLCVFAIPYSIHTFNAKPSNCHFEEVYIEDAVKEKKNTASSISRKSAPSGERYVKYFITDDDEKIYVSDSQFKEYDGPGTYYLGMTNDGVIFSIYSGDDYELDD
ncbi:MAG: hypothetical protein J6U54_17865 [Clostridiales bacterium]|nr:hypothetical protein [Clostridiales bacterium]